MTIPPNDKSSLNGHAKEVIVAIERQKQKFISPEGIAKEVGVDPDAVRSFLDARQDLVRRADVRDQNGNGLYALASEPVTLIERWGRLYSYINKEPLPSYRPKG